MRIKTFQEFYPFYLSQHEKRTTKWMHACGLLVSVSLGLYLLLMGCWWGILLGLFLGYFPAWMAHFFVEKNRPATFQYPLWSFVSDFRMTYELLTGKL